MGMAHADIACVLCFGQVLRLFISAVCCLVKGGYWEGKPPQP